MKVFITGGTGFVGTELTRLLLGEGHDVSVMARHEVTSKDFPTGAVQVIGDGMKPGKWQEEAAHHDVLINLAGVSIFGRWTESYKKLMRDSRILTTRNLVSAIPRSSGSDMTLISTSAIGYYGFTGDEELDETAPPGDDFLARLAMDWEAEALKAEEKGVRVVRQRFGVVLGKGGGALSQMLLPFKMFVGGPIGSGKQWFSWIHRQDLIRATQFLMETPELKGPFNFTAPNPVRNEELAEEIGAQLGRPTVMRAPGFMIKLVMGEFGSVVLKGQRVVPRRLQERGFTFNYPSLKAALGEIIE